MTARTTRPPQPDPTAAPVTCDLCGAVLYLWPIRLRGEHFDHAAETIRLHLARFHGVRV